jgi:hypothetical protein
MLISLLLILWGTLVIQFERTPTLALSNRRVWILNWAGVALALYVFMADAIAVSPHGLEAIRTVLPGKFNWPLFCVALALMSAPVVQIIRQLWLQSRARTAVGEPPEEFRCTRNPQN